MTYLERYLRGEHEAVWNELLALGEAVRQEPVYSDAKAVAAETMQRTRRNIEKIYQRLKSIGYQFDSEKQAPNLFEGLEKQLGSDSLLGSIFGNMVNQLKENLNSDLQSPQTRRAYNPPEAGIIKALDDFEREVGLLPLSVRAWCEIVGDVDFIGDYPKLASFRRDGGKAFDIRGMLRGTMAQNPEFLEHLDTDIDLSDVNTPLPLNQFQKLMREEAEAAKALANAPKKEEEWWTTDPLCFAFDLDIELAHELAEELEEEDEEALAMEEGARFAMMVAPDYLHKANISGSSYDIMLPNARADAFLHGADLHFVAYLRKSFEWAGFPMLADYPERDEALITMLKEGLEPI